MQPPQSRRQGLDRRRTVQVSGNLPEQQLIILSDEIYCDLLYSCSKHTVTATLSEELEQHTLTFMSASKTFNLAGLADDYLRQLLDYLSGNLDYFIDFINTRISQLRVIKPEGTYLAWVDMKELQLDKFELQKFIREKARLALDDGYAFGPGGEGFQRFNLACPRGLLEEALTRSEKAVNEL